MPNALYDALQGIVLKDFVDNLGIEGSTICCRDTDHVGDVVHLFNEHGICSVPVLDEEECCVGIIDHLDVISFINSKIPFSDLSEQSVSKVDWEGLVQTRAAEIINHSGRDPFTNVYSGDHLQKALDQLMHCKALSQKSGAEYCDALHRLPILAKDGKLCASLSQMDVLRYVCNVLKPGEDVKALMSRKLRSVQDMLSSVDTITFEKTTVGSALCHLLKKGYGGLPVVDESGKMKGSFCGFDIEFVFRFGPDCLLWKMSEFVEKTEMTLADDMTIDSLDISLGDMLDAFVQKRVHRAFIMGGDGGPQSIVTLTDCISFICTYEGSEEESATGAQKATAAMETGAETTAAQQSA